MSLYTVPYTVKAAAEKDLWRTTTPESKNRAQYLILQRPPNHVEPHLACCQKHNTSSFRLVFRFVQFLAFSDSSAYYPICYKFFSTTRPACESCYDAEIVAVCKAATDEHPGFSRVCHLDTKNVPGVLLVCFASGLPNPLLKHRFRDVLPRSMQCA